MYEGQLLSHTPHLQRPAVYTSVLEDKDAYKVDNEASDRDNHQSVMLDLGRLKCPLQGKKEVGSQPELIQQPFSTAATEPTSMASAKIKKAINRRKRAFTNPAMTSALTNLYRGGDSAKRESQG